MLENIFPHNKQEVRNCPCCGFACTHETYRWRGQIIWRCSVCQYYTPAEPKTYHHRTDLVVCPWCDSHGPHQETISTKHNYLAWLCTCDGRWPRVGSKSNNAVPISRLCPWCKANYLHFPDFLQDRQLKPCPTWRCNNCGLHHPREVTSA